jgi:hypothetical protein
MVNKSKPILAGRRRGKAGIGRMALREVSKHHLSLTPKPARFPPVFTLMAFAVSSDCSGGIPTSLSLSSC